MITYQKNLLHDSAVSSELDELFTPNETTTQDNGAIAQGNEAFSAPGSASPGSPS